MARVKAETKAAELAAKEELAGIVETNQPKPPPEEPGSGGNPLPFPRDLMNKLWMGGGFREVVETVVDEGAFNKMEEFSALVAELDIEGALTSEVVRAQLNVVERNALRAHRLMVLAKVSRERFKIEMDIALGAMSEHALADLSKERTAQAQAGEKSKQITIDDVRKRCAILFPDEWRELNDRLESAEQAVKHCERLAELWQRRSFTLSTLAG